ncbi:unnamed protein product [Gordionus sp. m RMFG-2023]
MNRNMIKIRYLSKVKSIYNDIYQTSINKPEYFWSEQSKNLFWHEKYDKILDNSNSPFNNWFVGGKFNICYNSLDRHCIEGHGHQKAIIHDSPLIEKSTSLTYQELLNKVSRLAGYLVKNGVKPGDRVLIYMPMIPEAIVGILACSRIGAIHSLVFGGFGAKELSVRIKHAEPKLILTASHGIEPTRFVPYKPIMDQALKFSNHKPNKCLIYQRKEMKDKICLTSTHDDDWEFEMTNNYSDVCIPLAGESPLYIIYTSGTTGLPKGIVRPSAGYAVALKWSMTNIFNVHPGEVFWAASDLGWVVGHSYACYGPLLNRNTTILYEGKPIGTPNAAAYFRIIDNHNVSCLFAAPTAIRAIRREDPEALQSRNYDLKSLKSIFLAGEHCDHGTLEWAKAKFGVPVIDHWWQSETGWPVTACCLGLMDKDDIKNIRRGVSGKPVPGWDVKIYYSHKPKSNNFVTTTNGPSLIADLYLNKVNVRDSVDESRPLEKRVVMDDDKSDVNILQDEKLGRILIKLPLPPGFMTTLWKSDDYFTKLYFSNYHGYYDTYDAGKIDEDNFVSVMSRIDDVMNVAGHRLSAAAIEEAIMENTDLAECAVIAVPDALKGHVPLAFCVPNHGVNKTNELLILDTIKIVRDVMGPVASLKLICIVPKLPKTRSGKVSRLTMTALAIDKPFEIPVTIEDPKVYYSIRKSLQQLGYALKNTQIFE